MKGSAFALVVLIFSLTVAGWLACAVSDPGARKGGQTLLADRVETEDSVTYTTDPDLDRTMKKEDREEKAKEENSWKMLQNMHLYGPAGKQPSSTGQSASPSQSSPSQ